ncbi:MAG: EAL domain-containing protein [Proteobacteria bacterium]|nr:EAL domain-containing protein [Pseudomonadota bacterium]
MSSALRRSTPYVVATLPPPPAPPWMAVLEGLPLAAWVVALADRSVVAANAQACALLGRPLAELLDAPAASLLATPEDLSYWEGLDEQAPASLHSQALLCAGDGRLLHVERCIRPVTAPGAAAASHLLVSLRDRSAEQQAGDDRETAAAELRATLEATADGILVTDLAGRIRSFNHRFAQLWNMPESLLEVRDDAKVHDWMRRSVDDPEAYQRRLAAVQDAALLSSSEQLRLHAGQVLERVSRPLWQRGRPAGRVYSFRDLTRQLAADRRIEQLSTTDGLTGLPNRSRLSERVLEAAAQSRRAGEAFALMLIDLDRFRQINDSLGHGVGDEVLRTAAQRIQGCLRHSDDIARVGGDQFAVLLPGADSATAETLARRVLTAVAQPSHVDGAQFTLTCSIGVALCPQHGRTLDDLVRHAEAAMREVKDAGRGNFRLHQPRVEDDLRQHMRLDHAMRQALVSGRFRLNYQPQVDLASGRVVGSEALIRWRDPELGDVSPARFIPVAEETGFIIAIGDWVLSQAMRQATLWKERGTPMPIAVNVSALQFQQINFIDRVASMLAVSGLPPHLLELELTESILVRHADEALRRLQALSRLGLRLSIDDFGTGYSSLAYLKRFPIDKLKIDRSFVRGLPDDESDAGIVRAILQMARALGKQVIAEGVETEPQRAFLQAEGCAQFQGFLFSAPLDSLSFEQRLLRRGGAAVG